MSDRTKARNAGEFARFASARLRAGFAGRRDRASCPGGCEFPGKSRWRSSWIAVPRLLMLSMISRYRKRMASQVRCPRGI